MPPYSLVPVAPSFTAPPSNMTVMAPPPPALHGMNQDKQAWLMDVARTGDLALWSTVDSPAVPALATSLLPTSTQTPAGRDMIQFPIRPVRRVDKDASLAMNDGGMMQASACTAGCSMF
ncbi:hypothetical protein GUJ93_ZPchr0310g6563 [Zizania palustris]|uniref:Uncharacterized protein n=1 Tax=Zizania palustris TaxID=103762 RepID=A0A8J5UZ72_ZIZPA|nr:hypothetical protein GUJ93_ZPchr0310g6563 [Zizania palustris]